MHILKKNMCYQKYNGVDFKTFRRSKSLTTIESQIECKVYLMFVSASNHICINGNQYCRFYVFVIAYYKTSPLNDKRSECRSYHFLEYRA